MPATSQFLQNNADDYSYLSEHLKECSAAADAVAYSLIRFDDAMQDVASNYDNWKKMLNSKDVREVSEAVADLRKTYGNLFDIDGSVLSDDFLKQQENVDKLNTILHGTEEQAIKAYDELQRIAALNIAENAAAELGVSIDADQFYTEYDNIMSIIDQLHLAAGDPITLEANPIEYSALVDSLNSMLAMIGNNVDAAHALMAEMG